MADEITALNGSYSPVHGTIFALVLASCVSLLPKSESPNYALAAFDHRHYRPRKP